MSSRKYLSEFETLHGRLMQKLEGMRDDECRIWLEQYKRFCEGEICWQHDSDVITQTSTHIVDCSESLQKMIRSGNYDSVDNRVNSQHFPLKSSTKSVWEFMIFRFDDQMAASAVKDYMFNYNLGRRRWHSASIEHLLAFGRNKPEQQRVAKIVALDSICFIDGMWHWPILWGNKNERTLEVEPVGDGLIHPHYQVLGVRRSTF